jgi:hypothetical protein
MARGLAISCGCFGEPYETVGAGTIARAAGVLVASIAIGVLIARQDRQAAKSAEKTKDSEQIRQI